MTANGSARRAPVRDDGRLQVRVLGQVHIQCDGQMNRAGSGRLRTLLDTVDLVAAVWGPPTPKDPRAAPHILVSQLATSLGLLRQVAADVPGGVVVLVTARGPDVEVHTGCRSTLAALAREPAVVRLHLSGLPRGRWTPSSRRALGPGRTSVQGRAWAQRTGGHDR